MHSCLATDPFMEPYIIIISIHTMYKPVFFVESEIILKLFKDTALRKKEKQDRFLPAGM